MDVVSSPTPRSALFCVAVSLFGACAKPSAPETSASPDAPPLLPAPEGTTYALGETTPADPIVARVVNQGLFPWVESLAGAATALVLDENAPLTVEHARWAAIRAGYPHAVVNIVTGVEPHGAFPNELSDALRPIVKIGDHVGIVRARTNAGDRWLALVGRPRTTIHPFPREYPVGATLDVTSDDLASWHLVSPTGDMFEGRIPIQVPLDRPGEWLLDLRRSGLESEQLLSVPLYVGMTTPVAPVVLPAEDAASRGVATLRDDVLDGLYDIRRAFGLPDLTWDQSLANFALTPLQQYQSGDWSPAYGIQRLRRAGYLGGPVAQLACTAPDVPSCLSHLMSNADDRAALLNSGLRLVGAAGEIRATDVSLLLNLSSE